MPTLTWTGKDKVINHHQEVPFRVLEHRYGFNASTGQTNQETCSGNKIIHGDNLLALKTILPEYEGRIKCIYIDPPYNTGNEGWVYNDNVNDPKIKKWLGEVVGREGEDLNRHDKWLCMMYPRLKLLHKLLAEDGVLFISIDENEQANLKIVCDEIFGNNIVGTFIWKARAGKGGTTNQIAQLHEYVLVYSKNKNNISLKGDIRTGKKRVEQLRQWGQHDLRIDRPKMFYPFFVTKNNQLFVTDDDQPPDFLSSNEFITVFPIKDDGREGRWRVGKKTALELIQNNCLEVKENNGKFQIYRNFSEENVTETALDSILLTYGTASTGTIEVKEIFDEKVFDTTKPLELIKYLIDVATYNEPESIILDSFAGSGTTAHAVLSLNQQDGGNRKFILVEMEDYAETITAERVRRVIKGYGNIEGTGGEFDYYELGQPLFRNKDELNEDIPAEKIRNYVFYTETKAPLIRETESNNPYFLEKWHDTGYYFYYEKDRLTKLDMEFLATIDVPAEQHLIYADQCLLDQDFLANNRIIFKKIPRDITRF